MSIVGKIIGKFGSQSALARLLGKKQSTVQNWVAKNRIPTKWQQPLIDLALKEGIDLQPSDFFEETTSSEDDNIIEPINTIDNSVQVPRATHWGELHIGSAALPCYVLETGDRVFSLKGVVVGLIGTKGGQLTEYLKVKPLQPYLPIDLTPAEDGTLPALITFDTGGEAFAKYALGLPVEKLIDLCGAYSAAAEREELTDRQKQIAITANAFLRASSKVGIIALVDEATGYQYERAEDALQFKLKLYLEDEMRKWEKTFPDELWHEFGRLTNWKGSVSQYRPKYWGKLVMELVYGYLDKDVAEWLKNNAPKPRTGQNYHQWLSNQYGLNKLVQHIWMLIGMAKTCTNMSEFRRITAEHFGRVPVQITMFLPPPTRNRDNEKAH